ncbi:hybrid signal transduction histidine kinase M [Tanacetum coccineum]
MTLRVVLDPAQARHWPDPTRARHFGLCQMEPFPDLKTVRFMLTTAKMRLKSRAQATYVNSTSSSPMVLLANSGSSTLCSHVAMNNINKLCFNFNKGFCRFGEHCKFLYNRVLGNPSLWSNSAPASNVSSSSNMTPNDMMALIQT